MEFRDSLDGGDTLEKRADVAMSVASLWAIKMCQEGSIAQVPGAIKVKDETATMCVSAALLHAVMFCVSFDYFSKHDCNISNESYQDLFNVFCSVGDDIFRGRFGYVWRLSYQCIHAPDALHRILVDAKGDPVSLRMSAIVECVSWTLRALNMGVPSTLMTRDAAAFMHIVMDFDLFCVRTSPTFTFGLK